MVKIVDYDASRLPLNEWDYSNIQIKGGYVFWDLYDESGTKTTSNNTTKQIESFVGGLAVTLYDTDGTTVIDQQVTDTIAWNASGTPSSFLLQSYNYYSYVQLIQDLLAQGPEHAYEGEYNGEYGYYISLADTDGNGNNIPDFLESGNGSGSGMTGSQNHGGT